MTAWYVPKYCKWKTLLVSRIRSIHAGTVDSDAQYKDRESHEYRAVFFLIFLEGCCISKGVYPSSTWVNYVENVRNISRVCTPLKPPEYPPMHKLKRIYSFPGLFLSCLTLFWNTRSD